MINPNAHDGRITPSGCVARAARVAALLAAVGLLAGCAGDLPMGADRVAVPGGPSLQLNPACAGSGGVTHGDTPITTAEHWYPADNPHRVPGNIHVVGGGHLRLHAGVLVCFDAVGNVSATDGGTLAIEGRDTALVVLTAADLDWGWGGIHLSGTPSGYSSIRNARIEHTRPYAVYSADRHRVEMDSVHLRQNGNAVALHAPLSRMRRSVVDTTTNAGGGAVVSLSDSTRFNQNVIRGAAYDGLLVLATAGVQLGGGRIEGSARVGMYVSGGVSGATPIRVVGSGSYGAILSADAMGSLYPDAAAQDSLLGNARDTVFVLNGVLRSTLHAQPGLPWRVEGLLTVSSGGILRAFPGANLALQPGASISAELGGRLALRGAPGNPVVLTAADTANPWGGIFLDGAPTTSTALINVRIEHASNPYTAVVFARPGHRVAIDSTVIRQTGYAVRIESDGSRISRSRVDTTRTAGMPAVTLASDAVLESTLIRGSAGAGLLIDGPADVRSCEIRESADEGIRMELAVQVRNCNLAGNGGPGIMNLDASTADARNNWWGDAAGPAGPGGDGASGLLLVSPWRTTPYVLPYVP